MISGVVLLGDLWMCLQFALSLSSSTFIVSIYDNMHNMYELMIVFDLLRTDANSCTEEVEGHVQ